MPEIRTLVKDIYDTVQKEGWWTTDLLGEFHIKLSQSVNAQRGVPRLRLSQMGERCPCALWSSIHTPELSEPLPPWARVKYTYGHIIEAYVICLAKAAGHEVTGEQDELNVDGVTGHRDCVIDGCIVDVKSTSSRGFQKFKDGSIRDDDPFGYLDQLDGYLVGSQDDPLVRNKNTAYLLAIDKQLGHICLFEHKIREQHIRNRIQEYKDVIALSSAPKCTCEVVPEGKSGNMKLGIVASYSAYKRCCFPNLRTFAYSNGPIDLTKVVVEPKVPEIINGKLVLH